MRRKAVEREKRMVCEKSAVIEKGWLRMVYKVASLRMKSCEQYSGSKEGVVLAYIGVCKVAS
jgi:hypothetical protein